MVGGRESMRRVNSGKKRRGRPTRVTHSYCFERNSDAGEESQLKRITQGRNLLGTEGGGGGGVEQKKIFSCNLRKKILPVRGGKVRKGEKNGQELSCRREEPAERESYSRVSAGYKASEH